MALDRNRERVAKGAKVKWNRDRAIYCGTVADVLEIHPFNVISVRCFNGREFRANVGDFTLCKGI